MLVHVKHKGLSKWVRVPQKDDVYSYPEFIQEVLAKFNLPESTSLILKDGTGVEVDPDIFDELLNSTQVSFQALTKECGDDGVEDSLSDASLSDTSFSEWSPSHVSASSSSGSDSIILKTTKARKRQLAGGPSDSTTARDIVKAALQSKPCGDLIFKEYDEKKFLSDDTTRKMVDMLVADMVETHGRIPPVNVRILYALGITTLFPNLRDPDSKNGYLYGDECKEAMSMMRHSVDKKVVKDKMMATFHHRQNMVKDPATASSVLDHFPRFLDTPGLIDQDFTMLFGEEVSGKFLSRWPTYFKPRILGECKNLNANTNVSELLLSAQDSNNGVWDSEVAAILLLLHLLPPTFKGRKVSKMSASDAVNLLVRFVKVGKSMETFLKDTGPVQPFLLCVGEKKNSLQNFYIALDQKVIPCSAQTGVVAFDELFKAHFVFSVSYDEALHNFFTFIQTTVYGIDSGSVKESAQVKELRARLLHSEL